MSDSEKGVSEPVGGSIINSNDQLESDLRPIVPHPRKDLPLWRWILSLVGLYLGALLYGLDTTIAADVQAPVVKSFGHIELLPWVGLGFPMASVAVILLVGRLYGLFNVKWTIIAFIGLFEVGSALCGAAPSMNALIVGRVIAGMGGAGMYLGALTYISIFSTPQEAPIYNALIGMSWGTGAILGPVVGGAFSQSSATWRWAFYINLPLAGVLSPVYFFVNPSRDPRPDILMLDKIKSLDWLGSILNAGTYVIFMIVLTFSGSTWSWKSGQSIGLWVLWGCFLCAFVAQQSFSLFTTTHRRIFPVHFLKSRTMVLLYVATACGSAANAVTLYYVPLFFQFTRGDDALKAAVRLLPYICVFVFSVMFAGALLPRFGRYAPWYLVGGAIMLAGAALMFVADESTSTQRIYGYEALIAIGVGLTFQNAYGLAAAKVSYDDRPNAIGFINVAQLGTIAISLAMAGCLFQNLGFAALTDALREQNFSEGALRSLLAGAESDIFSRSSPEVARLATAAVAQTISRLYGIVIGAGAVLIVVSLLMKWEKLQLQAVAGG